MKEKRRMRNSCLDVWECRRRHLEDCHTEWNAGDPSTCRRVPLRLELEGLSNEATVLYPEVKETLEELHRRASDCLLPATAWSIM